MPIQVGLTILLDEGPATPLRETSDRAEGAAGSSAGSNVPLDAVSFLENDIGRRVFSRWQRGFVTSLLVRDDFGPDILEASERSRVFWTVQFDVLWLRLAL